MKGDSVEVRVNDCISGWRINGRLRGTGDRNFLRDLSGVGMGGADGA